MSTDDVHPDEMPDELDTFLDDLRSAATAAPEPVVGAALATLFREGTAPMAAPAPRRRIGVRAAVAGVVAGLAFGGLGVAGALPGPVQQRVADVVDHVGVHLPDDRPATTTSTVPPTTTTSTTRPVAVPPASVPATTPTTADDHGGGPGRSGEDHGKSDEDHGKAGEDHGGSGTSGKGKGGDDTSSDDTGSEDDGSGRGRSGRTPTDGADVHVDSGSHSGHDDGGQG